ncbi:MAG: hypothetical protein ACLFQB_00995 [Chitinispirillaceae bacterium]
MKKASVVVSCILLLVFSTYAQNIVSLFGDVGYGFGMGSYYLGSSNTIEGGDTLETEDHFLNLGHGAKLEMGLGYMAGENLETRFSVDLSFGVPSPTIESSITNATGTYSTTTDYSYFSWGIKALVAPHFELLEIVDAYVGVGVGLNFATSSYETTVVTETITEKATFNNETPAALGFIGVAGFDIPLSDLLYVFGEARFEPMNFKIKKVTLENLNISEDTDYDPRPVNYEENVTDRPPPPNIPGTNWGLRVGVKLWIF